MENEDKKTVFEIPEPNFATFTAKIEKISKKAVKISGNPIKPVILGEEFREVKTEEGKVTIKFFKVFLDAPVAKIDGWNFVATVDHTNDGGNIIRSVPNTGIVIPVVYRDCPPNCEHCKINRRRNETFVLFNDDTTEYKQVGRNCLADFFGRDPMQVARVAEYLSLAAEIAEGSEDYEGGYGASDGYVSLEVFLEWCAESIRRFGWVSRASEDMELGRFSTSTDAQMTMEAYRKRDTNRCPTDADRKTAEEAIEWVRVLPERAEPLNDFLYNISIVGKSTYIKWKNMGLAAAIVFAFLKEKTNADEGKDSTFVGEVGGKVEFTAKVTKFLTFDGMYGRSYVYLMQDENGNVFKYSSSKPVDVMQGDMVKVSSKVKKHEEYKGVKQTIIGGRGKNLVEKIEG